MRRNKRKTTKMSLLMMLLLLGIGFAALTANLKINGTVDVLKANWDVHFENVQIKTGSVTATTVPTSDDETTTEMTYAVSFAQPGDFYEFTVDIVNDGSMDAMVDVVTNKVYSSDGETEITIPNYLKSSVTYNDGVEIKPNQLLAKETSEKIKVRVEYRTDIDSSDLPSSADTIIFKFSGTYKQKDGNAKPVRVDFSTASWNEITTAYENNPSSLQQSMLNGTTKEVQLDLDNDGTSETTGHLRIANISTPAECSTPGFSQTACGLVIEFADVITEHTMNPWNNSGDSIGDGNRGGWEYSDMRAYINSGKYLEGTENEVDYSKSGIYNALPKEIKSRIIDTTVVSGYGYKDSANFTTTDKLYLLSSHEVWVDVDGNVSSGIDYYDKAYNNTRQLDYYEAKRVTTINYYEAAKMPGAWWLRTSDSYYSNGFFGVYFRGDWYGYPSSNGGIGVSPAFRIG